MSDNFITQNQVTKWFEDLEVTLQTQIVTTGLSQQQQREELYNLYQASQVLKARFLQDFSMEIEMPIHGYDDERFESNDNT